MKIVITGGNDMIGKCINSIISHNMQNSRKIIINYEYTI